MARTIRKLPHYWHRKPRYKQALQAGVPKKQVTTDWDDKPVAARREMRVERNVRRRQGVRCD